MRNLLIIAVFCFSFCACDLLLSNDYEDYEELQAEIDELTELNDRYQVYNEKLERKLKSIYAISIQIQEAVASANPDTLIPYIHNQIELIEYYSRTSDLEKRVYFDQDNY